MSIKSRFARWGIGSVGIAIGLILVVLSLPRVIAYSYIAMVPSGVIVALSTGRPIDGAMLDEARELYLKALNALPGDAVLQQDYGRLELRRAADRPDERIAALKSASEHFRASIVAAPARSFAWSLEAYSQEELNADPALLNALLRMSYYAGPHEASSVLLRAQVGCRIWDKLDEDVRGFVSEDLKTLWADGRLRSAVIDIYFRSSLATRSSIRKNVLTDTESQKRFDQMLKRDLKKTVH